MTATIVPPPSHRVRFLKAVEALLGKPVLWGAKGPDAFDCSGSVTHSLKEIGGPDLTATDNAHALHSKTRELGAPATEHPLPGDLVFYGVIEDARPDFAGQKVRFVHVAVVDEFGGVISADGATPSIKTLSQAVANPANRVRRHNTLRYRKDCPVVVVCRNTLVDNLDLVSR